MKYQDIIEKRQTLINLSNLTLPRKVSVAIARNLAGFDNEIKVYNSQKEDIASRYAKKSADGDYVLDSGRYTFETTSDKEAFLQEAKELNETDVEIKIIKCKSGELDKCDDSDRYSILTPAQEIAINWMIDYEEAE